LKVPLYDYGCPNCGAKETRLAGVDDQRVVCPNCGAFMERPQGLEEIFAAYWPK